MVLEWLGKSRDADALIARRRYTQAIDAIEELLARHGADARLRMKLADVLVMAGRGKEAVPVLLSLADELAAEGQAAKSIALLKKVQRISPGRSDVDIRLADVIKARDRRQPGFQPRGPGAAGYEPKSWSASSFGAEHFSSPAIPSDEQRIEAVRKASWVPSTRPEEDTSSMLPLEVMPQDDALTAREAEIEILGVIQDALAPEAGAPAVPRPAGEPAPFVDSPLFSGFSRDELVAVIRGLRLLAFEPGDIVLTEGDPGDSLFVLTEGRVKAFVRDGAQRRQMLMRELGEGDFFGEISILSGRARSATVTAATRCEMLELDRPTLEEISQSYPNVRRVLEEFYLARALNTPEAPGPPAV